MTVTDRLRNWLAMCPQNYANDTELTSAMAQVCPEVSVSERRQELLMALHLLAAQNVIALPKRDANWTSAGGPSLPKAVWIFRSREASLRGPVLLVVDGAVTAATALLDIPSGPHIENR